MQQHTRSVGRDAELLANLLVAQLIETPQAEHRSLSPGEFADRFAKAFGQLPSLRLLQRVGDVVGQ